MRRKRPTRDRGEGQRERRFKCIQNELTEACGLLPDTPENRLRITEACWLRLARENLEARILAGHVVDMTEMQRCAEALAAILPKAQHTLHVHFIDEKPPDLTKLTNAEFDQLQQLMAICRGEAPPTPLPENERVRPCRG